MTAYQKMVAKVAAMPAIQIKELLKKIDADLEAPIEVMGAALDALEEKIGADEFIKFCEAEL